MGAGASNNKLGNEGDVTKATKNSTNNELSNKSEDTKSVEYKLTLEEALNAGPQALQLLLSKASEQINAKCAIDKAIESRDRAELKVAIETGEAAGLPEGDLAPAKEILNSEEFFADTVDASADKKKTPNFVRHGKNLAGKVQKVAAQVTTLCVQVSGSPRKPSWSLRLHLMMRHIRRLSQLTQGDMDSLRVLADAAGLAGLPISLGVRTEEIADFNGVKCKRMWPDDMAMPPKRYVMYIHGGAYCMGSSMTHTQIASVLAKKTHATVLLPDYRLCPENTVTDAIEDCMKVYGKLLSDIASELGEGIACAARRVVVGGESAGAALSLGLALKLREKCQSDEKALPQPAGLLLMSPWANLLDAMEQNYPSWTENAAFDSVTPELAKLFAQHVLSAQNFGGNESEAAQKETANLSWSKLVQAEKIQADLIEIAKTPEVSPALAPSFESLPATLVTIGGGETLRDSQRELVKRMRESQVDVTSQEFEDMPHAVALLNFVEDSRMRYADKSNEVIQNGSPMDVALQSVDFINKCIPDRNARAGFDTCKWMFTQNFNILAKNDPLRWSGSLKIPDAISDLQKQKEDRPITLIAESGKISQEYKFSTAKEVIDFLNSASSMLSPQEPSTCTG